VNGGGTNTGAGASFLVKISGVRRNRSRKCQRCNRDPTQPAIFHLSLSVSVGAVSLVTQLMAPISVSSSPAPIDSAHQAPSVLLTVCHR
jgi:hypothetical protein